MQSVKGLALDLNLDEGLNQGAARRPGAMRILVLGDFSGRSHDERVQSTPSLGQHSVVPIDIDNFEDVLRKFAPRLQIALPGADAPVEVTCYSLDDFCPDSLYQIVPLFASLRDIRGRLLDSETFSDASADLEALLGARLPNAVYEKEATDGSVETPAESDDQMIERLLGGPATSAQEARSKPSKAQAAVSDLIQHTLAPHSLSQLPPHRDLYVRALDESLGESMRALLHAPAFRSLEASWRALHHLVTNLETDEGLRIYLLDVSKQDLMADLAAAGGDLKASGLYRLLVEVTGPGTPGGDPWSLLVGNFDFASTAEDLGLLAAVGLVAASAGGPFLAAASPKLLGCRSLAETPDPFEWNDIPAEAEAAWNALRQTPIAPWIGLALPRVLLRLPYGKDTEPVDAFEFEELEPERHHEDYLWGNPALACALLIGQAYTARGWEMAPGDVLDLGDMPAHVYQQAGDKHLQACAETYLTGRAAAAILDRGIMPLLSFKGRNLVRLARFQSIASPPMALMGSWRG